MKKRPSNVVTGRVPTLASASRFAAVPIFAGAALLACGGTAQPASSPNQSLDPTPLSRCKVGGGAANPLVTEWAASEKARLEALLQSQPVAVRYTGCELQVVEQCQLEGQYEWRRTTLATDSVEIRSEDELYAKLPVGAATLSGELSKSGQLTVRTRVAGQLRLTGAEQQPALDGNACQSATHLVSAVSLGAFKLLRGTRGSYGGSVETYGAGVEAGSTQSEGLVKEAGSDTACDDTTAEAPHPNCASPLQLFLSPLREDHGPPPDAGPQAVDITFPPTEGQRWWLENQQKDVLCELPCRTWVSPKSGYVLRSDAGKSVKVPDVLPYAGGGKAEARYSPQRGSPTVSAWLFWAGGAWMSVPGIALTSIGISLALEEPSDCDPNADPFCEDRNDHATFFIVGGAVHLVLSGASLYYYLYSEEETFALRAPGTEPKSSAPPAPGRYVRVGPGFVDGRF